MSRTIAISDEAYKLLKRSKLPGESFSSVITRSLRKGKLSEIVGSGTISRADWEDAMESLLTAEAISSKKLRGVS
ncbi:MAG: hypothetical protein HYU39_04845 [Thaumarchaeota archaeon]|nr:hypothetical protein [Nitrososphaerota archaeon]